jgi:hypothetical protein
MALSRRAPELEAAGAGAQRPRAIAALRAALSPRVPTAAGWLCLTQLSLKAGDAAGALEAAKAGLSYVRARESLSKEKFLQARPRCLCQLIHEPNVSTVLMWCGVPTCTARRRSFERTIVACWCMQRSPLPWFRSCMTTARALSQAGLALRLEAAQALLQLGRLDDAAAAFGLLETSTSGGELTFPIVAGIAPLAVHQQAARGLAKARTMCCHCVTATSLPVVTYNATLRQPAELHAACCGPCRLLCCMRQAAVRHS